MLHALALTAALLVGDPGPFDGTTYPLAISGAAFTDVACNTTLTFDAKSVGGFRFLRLNVKLTRSAATDVQMTCKGGDASTDVTYKIPVEQYVGATAYTKQKTWRYPESGVNLSGSDSWTWLVDLYEYLYVQCSFVCTSGAVGDLLSVSGRAGYGQ